MSSELEREIAQTKPISASALTFLNLQRTTNLLVQSFQQLLKPARLTPTQYNALRILRGAAPHGHSCREIGRRLVTPVPDTTRLVERLVRSGWARRRKDDVDRRVVLVTITPTGSELLRALDPVVDEWMTTRFDGLGERTLAQLAQKLEELRQGL